jgi:hypothetical protein
MSDAETLVDFKFFKYKKKSAFEEEHRWSCLCLVINNYNSNLIIE